MGKTKLITAKWEGIAGALAVVMLGLLAVAMVLSNYPCSDLYPIVALVATLGGISVGRYISK